MILLEATKNSCFKRYLLSALHIREYYFISLCPENMEQLFHFSISNLFYFLSVKNAVVISLILAFFLSSGTQ